MKKLFAAIATVALFATIATAAVVTNITTKTMIRYEVQPLTNGFRYAYSGAPAVTNMVITQIHDIWRNGQGLAKSTNVVYTYEGYPTTNRVYDIYYKNIPVYYPVVVTNIVVR
jgi:hypothetical protein